jgi:ABC-type enterochelin transport system substrate-binding protein
VCRVLIATPNFNIKAGKNQVFFEKFFKINTKFINFTKQSANFFDQVEKEKETLASCIYMNVYF